MRGSPDQPKPSTDPLWMSQLDWPQIVHELGLGHALKFIWKERAQTLTSYSTREVAPGERVEVDYAGDTLE
jgi:hypothetical protein